MLCPKYLTADRDRRKKLVTAFFIMLAVVATIAIIIPIAIHTGGSKYRMVLD